MSKRQTNSRFLSAGESREDEKRRLREIVKGISSRGVWPVFVLPKTEFENLKERHSIPPQFDLLRKLRSIAYEVERKVRLQELPEQAGGQSIKELKRFVSSVSAKSEALRAKIHEASDDELAFLMASHSSVPTFTIEDMNSLGLLLNRLVQATRVAGSRSFNPGAKPRRHRTYIVVRLRELYVDAIGDDAPRISKDDEFSGPFFEFVKEVLPLFGIRWIGDCGLGHVVMGALKNSAERKQRSKKV